MSNSSNLKRIPAGFNLLAASMLLWNVSSHWLAIVRGQVAGYDWRYDVDFGNTMMRQQLLVVIILAALGIADWLRPKGARVAELIFLLPKFYYAGYLMIFGRLTENPLLQYTSAVLALGFFTLPLLWVKPQNKTATA